MFKYKIYTLLVIFGLITPFVNAQNKKESIIKALTKSVDTLGVHNVKASLKEEFRIYKAYFNFVPSINPLNPKKQKRFSSKFGKRFHPKLKKIKAHHGLDISAKIATPIHAGASGTVIETITSNKGYGNRLSIKHMYGFTTLYAHLYVYIVKKGQRVKKGEIIGYVGNTGLSTGPHLHYEIRKFDRPVDPYPFCFLDI